MSLLTYEEVGADRDASRRDAVRQAIIAEHEGSPDEARDALKWLADEFLKCDSIEECVAIVGDMAEPITTQSVLDAYRMSPEWETDIDDRTDDELSAS